MLAALVYFFAPQGLGHHLLYDLLGLSSVAAILYGVRLNRPASRTPWYLFAAGQLCFVVGDGIRAFYETVLGVESPFPGVADAAYIAAYPLLMVGLMIFVRSRDRAKDRGNLIDALIVATSVGVVSWVYLMEPYTSDPHVELAGDGDLDCLPAHGPDAARSGGSPHGHPRRASRGLLPPLREPGVPARVRQRLHVRRCSTRPTTRAASWTRAGSSPTSCWGAAALHPSMKEISKPVPQRELRITGRRMALLDGGLTARSRGADGRDAPRQRAAAVARRSCPRSSCSSW